MDPQPNVWVGKIAHGSYDNWCDGHGAVWEQDYCAGGCGYWDDFRNDNDNSRWRPSRGDGLRGQQGQEHQAL